MRAEGEQLQQQVQQRRPGADEPSQGATGTAEGRRIWDNGGEEGERRSFLAENRPGKSSILRDDQN